MPFTCSICGEQSTRICVRCTKDACNNHLCEKCLRCSDCCECEVTLDDTGHGVPVSPARAVAHPVEGPVEAALHESGPDSATPAVQDEPAAPALGDVQSAPEHEPAPPALEDEPAAPATPEGA